MNEEELQREIISGAFSMRVADCERNIRIQFEKLQQENEKLKKMVNFGGITIVNCPECNKEINVNFCRETEEYRKKYQQLKDRINKAINDIDKLEKDIMSNTIIGFNQFIPSFNKIKNDLKGNEVNE